VLFPLIARLPGSGLSSFMKYAKGANTIARLNEIQASFGFPLVLLPKMAMDLFGELLRPLTFLQEFGSLGFGDIHSMIIIPLFSIAMVTVLVIAYRRGRLNPRRPVGLVVLIYLIVTAVTPFVQPRYNYFVYVLLCLELAKKEGPDGQPDTLPQYKPAGAVLN
jgi:hypothetical protein